METKTPLLVTPRPLTKGDEGGIVAHDLTFAGLEVLLQEVGLERSVKVRL